MPAFHYLALDPQGRRRRGTLEGDSDRHARSQLRGQGLTPLRVETVVRRARPSWSSLFTPRVGGEQLALMTRLLATLVKSGLPLDEALLALSVQSDQPAMKQVIAAVRSRVLEGHSLGNAFAQFTGVFPELYIATVSAGEQTPHLGLVLERLADYIEERRLLQQKVQMAMLYPAILTVVSILIVAGLLTYVVPEVVKVFAHMNRQLPMLTRYLIATADFTRQWGLIALGAVIATAVAARRLARIPAMRLRLHGLMLRLPIIGKLITESDAGRFTRTLGILLRSGVGLIDALRISGKALANLPMRNAVTEATAKVQEGMALNQALRSTGRLPSLSIHLIASGEAAGNLDAMLDTAARMHERSLQTTLATLLALVEPLLILTMGLVVLLIVVAIMLPIFDMNRMV